MICLGKCTVNDLKGCECEKKCPTGDQQLKCEDDKCKGEKEGKCTVDGNKGCECSKNECPDDIDLPLCSDCGDLEHDKNLCKNKDAPCCKGVSDFLCAGRNYHSLR